MKKIKIKILIIWFESSVFWGFIDVIRELEERKMIEFINLGLSWIYLINLREIKIDFILKYYLRKRFRRFFR